MVVTTEEAPTSIEEVSQPTLKIYPNPAVNSIQINIDTPAKIEIYTSRGTMVRKSTINPGESINVSDLSQGLYFIRIITGGKTESLRMIKK